ncbi:MAG TPA: DDE-type integrase/transposase/recombinase [Acidimicrobiia bacterium]|jgi:transposase InsO family protein|nr:DDE-type integrase/transposase/recombinase [Acidimicrobiia bacterium]
MSVHDAVLEHRRRLVAVIAASPNRRLACAQAGIHPSTFYRWCKQPAPVTARPVGFARRHLESRVVAMALAHPAAGPRRVADLLAAQGVVVGPSRVWRILGRHRLNTRALRYRLLAAHRSPAPEVVLLPAPRSTAPGRLNASRPGELVQMDTFHVGSFKETRLGSAKAAHGQIWQYTAIDVASSYLWAELATTAHNPSAALTSALAHRVAADLAAAGWTLGAVSTDNGNEYRAAQFRETMAELGATHRFIRAGRPQSNGKVERAQGIILEECYQPALHGYVTPSITGLRRDLDDYLGYYNHDRPNWGRWNQGRTPTQIMYPNPKLHS